jgi:TPR repeat protein
MLKFCTFIACFLAISLTATHALSQDMSGWSDKTVCRILSQNPDNTEYLGEGVSRGLACASSTPSLKNIKPTKVKSTESADYQKGQDAFDKDDYKTAFNEWQPLADQGYAAAQSSLGWLYENGKGVLEDDEQAIKWYQKAADQGYAKAQYDLGSMYRSSEDVRQKSELSVTWYKTLYATAKGVLKNDTEAVKWYRKAANQGYAEAQYGLGRMYDYGEGVRESDNQAVKWYQKAADQGYAKAQSHLGLMYQSGKGVRKDYKQAVKWYQKAADQGLASAQKNVGWMYHNGKGVREDYKQAVKWYQKAADQGFASAQYNVGWMYQNGKGVLKDDIQAVKWYRKAANQGHAKAQKKLGELYREDVVTLIAVKSSDGKVDQQIPAKLYTRADLLELAANPDSDLSQLFSDMAWFKDGALATMDALPQGKYYYLYTRILGFNDQGTKIRIAHNINFKNYSNQVMIATWDIASKKLEQLLVLTPGTKLNGVSHDQNWLAVNIDNELMIYDSQSGKRRHVLKTKVKGFHRYEDATFSPDGRFLAASTYELIKDPNDKINDLLSDYVIEVFDVKTGKLIKEYRENMATTSKLEITFSPDSTHFLLDMGKCPVCVGEYGGERVFIQLGDVATWRLKGLTDLIKAVGTPQFSADGRSILTRTKRYDINQGKLAEGYQKCTENYSISGAPLLGQPLNYDIMSGTIYYNQLVANSCFKIKKASLPGLPKNFNHEVFSKDQKLIAVLGTNGSQDPEALQILDSLIPDAKAIAKAANKESKEATNNKLYEKVKKTFDSGFHEEALAMMNAHLETTGSIRDGRVAIGYILRWAPKLPLAEVGKSLLRHKSLIQAEPVRPSHGLYGSEKTTPKGYIIERPFPKSNADVAGIKSGDIILALNGEPVANAKDFRARIERTNKPGDRITLGLSRNGRPMNIAYRLDEKISNNVWAAIDIAEYGTVAAAAGHPELTLAAAKELRNYTYKYRSSINVTAFENFAVMLEALSMASDGDSIGAYKHAIKNGGFVKEFDIVKLFHFNNLDNRQFVAPLFQNRKKLAYLLGIEEAKLPKTPTHVFPAQAYPDLNGNIVGKGKKASKKKPGIKLLDD